MLSAKREIGIGLRISNIDKRLLNSFKNQFRTSVALRESTAEHNLVHRLVIIIRRIVYLLP